MHATWQAHGVKVVQVRITIKEEIHDGELTMAGAGRTRVFDCRASDGIAWAIHCGTPIFVEEAPLEKPRKGERPTDSQIVR